MSTREHGYARYKLDGCRCYVCGYAAHQYEANRARAIAYGTWQPYVDATPVRQHVRTLMDFGIGWKRIAALAAVPSGVVTKLLYGDAQRGMAPSKQVRPKSAEALLAVEASLEHLGSAVAINATGTRRRLQALVASGWPQARLAARLNMTPGNFSSTMQRQQVLIRTARLAAALYDELWREDPRQHGVDNQAYSRARNHAIARDWAPVGAWDDDTIDDPTAQPWCADARQLSRDELATVRREEVEHLDGCGLSEHEIAQRLEMAYTTVRNIVLELRTGTRRDRNPQPPSAPKAPRQPAQCGTRSGYQRHIRLKEPVDDACRQANSDADNRLRRTGSTRTAA